MDRQELNWLLQTIKDGADAERFVLAQYQRGRISFQLMADIARKRGWVNRTESIGDHRDSLLEVSDDKIPNCYRLIGVAACPSKV